MDERDDHTIHALRRAGRARRSEAEEGLRWQALTDGSLGEAEASELRAEADRSEEAGKLYELYRPLDDAEKERLYADVHRRRDPPSLRPRVPPMKRWRKAVAAILPPSRVVWGGVALTLLALLVRVSFPSDGPGKPLAQLRVVNPDSSRD